MGEGSPVIAAPRPTEKPSQQTSQPPSGSGNNASPSSKAQSMKQQPSVPKQQAEGNMQEVSSTTGSSSAPLPKRRNKRANKAASEPHQGQEASKGVNGGGPSRAEVPGETKNQGVIDGSQVSEAAVDTKSLTKTLVGVIAEMRAAGEQEVHRPDKPRPKPAPKASAETVPQAAKPAQSPMVPKTAAPQEQKGQGEGKPNRDRKAGKKNAATPAAGVSTASAPSTSSPPTAPTGTSNASTAAPVVINVHVPSPPRSHKAGAARSEAKAPRGPKPSAPHPPPTSTQAPPPPTTQPPTSSMQGTQQLSTLYKLGLGQSHGLVQEVVPVPHALLDWTTAKLGDLNSILAKVKEKSGVLSIVTEQCREDGSKRLLISASGADEAKKAKVLLEVHLKNQESLSFTERRLQKVEDDITAVQGAVAAGLRIEFTVDPELTGLVIGKKGENIKRVYEATGVSKIDVNDGIIRIVGPSNAAVLHAREMLELLQSDMELCEGVGNWLTRPMLGDIRDKSECSLIRVLDGEDLVRIIGTKKQVENAKLLLETQVDYVMKHKELRANESEMRQKLYDMEASYGMVPQYQRRGPFNANTNANAGRRGRNEDGGYERTAEGGSGEGRFERKPSSRQRPQPGSAEGAKTVVITTPSTAPASSSSSSGPAASANRGPRPSNGAQKWPTLKEATAKK